MTTDALLPTIIMAVIVLALEWIERRMTIH